MRVLLCGGVAVEVDSRRLPEGLLAGRQGRLVLAFLVCESHRSVAREELAEVVWGEQLPASWTASLSAVVSRLRHLLTEAGLDGGAALTSTGGGYRLVLPADAWVDWDVATAALARAEEALQHNQAEACLAEAIEVEQIAERGFITDDSLWVDEQRARLRDVRVRAVQIQAEAHLGLGARGSAVIAARRALELDPLRESSFRLVMRALAAAGERGEALRVWERCRALLVDELGTDPAPETEAVYLDILRDEAAPRVDLPSGVVTFLLTDIVDSSGLWERNPTAMSAALDRHNTLVADAARAQAGTMLKAKLEGDATVSVFPRASAGALAALNLRDSLQREPWPAGTELQVRMALHTGEAVERDGDYVGPAVNRAARLRGLAAGGQILASQAIAEVVREHLPAWAALRGVGHRQLRGLSRGENVFELVTASTGDGVDIDISLEFTTRPPLPGVLAGGGPFVGRDDELDRLSRGSSAASGTTRALLIAGEPGVGKTRLAGECAKRAHADGAVVLYGRCDEDLGAPYQPFAEAFRALVAWTGPGWVRSQRGFEVLASLVPDLRDPESDPTMPAQVDADSARYLLFDAVARLLSAASAELPIVLVLDDLQWAGKPTLLMLRHLLRFEDESRLRIVGTYRNTDLDRSHPLAAILADLQRDGTADRMTLTGLAELDVGDYLRAAGHDDQLAPALSAVTAGNPFFLIETLRNVEETGGPWDATTLPQGVREAVGRRLSRLSEEANEALLVGAVAGSEFALDVVERALGREAVDGVEEACHAALLIEERGGRFRFNHALVRQTLLAEVASVKRVRLHQRLAEALEEMKPAAADSHLADLAYHYFECAWAGQASKAVDYCRRAADQAMARLAYEEAADLYNRAAQAAELDTTPSPNVAERAELLIARCEALFAAGDIAQAAGAVAQLAEATRDSPGLRAWATCFDGQLAVLTHPERLDDTEQAVAAAAGELENAHDAAGEAKAHTVRASCLARLGRVADCEDSLDRALAAARRAGDHRRVNAVLAGAPLAALWGPSPLPRASGRCLDVVRVLRITTGSPVVEANALRCQAVLEAMRGRVDAARRMLDSARAQLEDRGLRTALLDLHMYAGIVELIADQPDRAATELRTAHRGFAQLGVDIDTAQAAALLARACLLLGLDDDADQLSNESAQLGGRDLKTAIAWRAVRAELLAARGQHDEALGLAEEAVALAASTDALVDHGDACLALSVVHRASGDAPAAQAAAERAAALYESKGATALAARAGRSLEASAPTTPPEPGAFVACPENVASRAARAARDMPERDVETLAVRGDRLALLRVSTEHTDDGAPPSLLLVEVDVAGEVSRLDDFGIADLAAAVHELDDRYVPELPPDIWAWAREMFDAYNAGDQERLRTLVADESVNIDRRVVGWGTTDRGEHERRVSELQAMVPDLFAMMVVLHRFSSRGLVARLRQAGTGPEGALFDSVFEYVAIVQDGREVHSEYFPLGHVDEAVRRFEELTAAAAQLQEATPNAPVEAGVDEFCPDNAASRVVRVALAALAAGDWAAFTELVSESGTIEDPRTGAVALGARADVEAWARPMTGCEIETAAVRGDRLALLQLTVPMSADGDVRLTVAEAGDDGRLGRLILLESTNLAVAVRTLESCDVERPMGTLYGAWMDALNAGDWERWRSTMAETFVNVDRRPMGWGTVDADEFVRRTRQLREMSPDVVMVFTVFHRWTAHGAAGRLLQTGTGPEGTRFEKTWEVVCVASGDKVVRSEYFPADHVEEALRRLDELTAELAAEPVVPDNAAAALAERLETRMNERDLDGVLGCGSRDLLVDDRRAGLGSTMDAKATERELDFLWSHPFSHVYGSTIAIRGDRLALRRQTYAVGTSSTDAAIVEFLTVHEIDTEGRLVVQIRFDIGDLAGAVAELDDRFAGSLHSAQRAFFAVARAMTAPYNAGDTERVRDLTTDDFVNVDRRPMGWGTVDREQLADRNRQLRELAPDFTVMFTVIHRCASHGFAARCRHIGTGPEGVCYENVWEFVAIERGGKLARSEYLPVGHVVEALRRLDELSAEVAGDTWVPDNAASATVARIEACVNRRDLDGALALATADVLIDDRRPGLRDSFAGADASARELDFFWSQPSGRVDGRTLAVRGDRLALRRQRYSTGQSSGDTTVVEFLTVNEVDGDGRLAVEVRFETHDIAAAIDELDARYAAGLPADVIEAWNLSRASVHAYGSQPEEELRTLLTDDFMLDDHRSLGWGTIDFDRWMGFRRELLGMATSASWMVAAVHRLTPHGCVGRIIREGTTHDGTPFEMVHEGLVVIRAGKISRVEFHPAGYTDEALRRFEELEANS